MASRSAVRSFKRDTPSLWLQYLCARESRRRCSWPRARIRAETIRVCCRCWIWIYAHIYAAIYVTIRPRSLSRVLRSTVLRDPQAARARARAQSHRRDAPSAPVRGGTRGRARGAGGRARDHPAAHGRRGDGNPARAHGRRHRACGGRPCVREGRFATPPVGSFEHAVFSRGFSRPRAPHDARRAGGSGEGLLERFAPRRLHRAVVEAPRPMACAAECANGTARCAPKRVEKL